MNRLPPRSHHRCRKCGMLPSEHAFDVCSSPFDPYHTTGRPDYVLVPGPPDRSLSADEFARRYQSEVR
jgi:hypothetical protein